ncbi:RdgB/HAM1 family non-canonical purine NTP pyrophosphatase [Neofamilia massiliensis]|uniref:RdgB/HAM1 family non-canonical purine NTP pyrophosphatase n=1 Tax=Neofamilia massiliensis TaxID=1673724 RepID=UPI001FA7B6B2|nr:RdgB/HAM1 family non-canonical purine NTP pyrophosphatase [Neofamilia massiliensis]
MEMKKILLATNNNHKVEEIQAILKDLGYEVLARDQVYDGNFDVDENADTLAGNALLKAQALRNLVSESYMVLADDTGLFVDALDGAPGVHSARYAGDAHDDEANKKKLLKELEDVSEEKRTARFKTVMALVQAGKDPVFIEGILEGKIAEEERGSSGFGYDPLFIPDGYSLSLGQMNPEEKNRISHRHNALIKLAEYLKELE